MSAGHVVVDEVGTSWDATGESDIVDVFRRRARQAPDAAAVIHDGKAVSYAQLDAQSDSLAHRLHEYGAGTDSVVGVLVDRSPHLPLAILAVLKAGAAFLPLDPNYPAERLAYMLSDANVAALISEAAMADRLRDSAGTESIPTVLLDDRSVVDALARMPPAGEVTAGIRPESLAYLIYTSGSSGRPKGVMIEHLSLATFAREVAQRLELGPEDRFLQFASLGFDVLVEELFPTWFGGGAVVIPATHVISGEDDLGSLAAREQVTVMELPTAFWHTWARELSRASRRLPDSLRLVIIGGERVIPGRLELWRATGVPLVHVYGLTETTVSSTFYTLRDEDPVEEWSNFPIGTGIPSAELYVLDRRMRPVPRGGTGELYIGGVSLARGYAGRPGLTAQRFVADPNPDRPGSRLYRTGDVVRRRPDGNLEFVSRADAQLKIRGFRVEPAEIEAVLSEHPKVAAAVVALHEPRAGDRRLIAHVVPQAGTSVEPSDLRQFLAKDLPEYMIPSAFHELDEIPLNTHGKVDRSRLPVPQEDRPQASADFVEPETAEQRLLAELVAGVVGVRRIGSNDNFFEVGGDSILAIQVVAKAQEAGLQLTPYDLFAHPTIASLAEAIGTGVVVDAEQGEVVGPAPLVPMQQWFGAQNLEQPKHWNTSVLLELNARVAPELIKQAVGLVVGHHDGLRQRFLLAGARSRCRIAPNDDEPPFAVHDLTGIPSETQDEQRDTVISRMQSSLDLAVGPLIRVDHFRLGPNRQDQLAVVVHRLVADAASLRLVLEDLETAMVQLVAGEELRFLPKTTSWQAWGRRIDTWTRSEDVDAERDYWESLVAAAPEPVRESNGGSMATASRVVVSLGREEADALARTVTRRLACTVEELLLAALARSLTSWTGQARSLINLERHTRSHPFDDADITRTVGWFSFTHPLLLTAGQEQPDATVREVREILRAVPGEGRGWGALRSRDLVPAAREGVQFTFIEQPIYAASGAFRVLADPCGGDCAAENGRPYPIEVRARYVRGELEVQWTFDHDALDMTRAEQLARNHLDELKSLVAVAAAPSSPQQFPLARVKQDQLAGLLERLQDSR